MLRRLFQTSSSSPEQISKSPYLTCRSSDVLLSNPHRQALISKVKKLISVTDRVWLKHYLYAIERFAEFAQELPASEVHHHSEHGGLLDHTLDALYHAMRIRQGFILPPNAEPEMIVHAADRWTFGVFTAILAHDVGKLVTDIEVVYRPERVGEFNSWHPWLGPLKEGVEYVFRYKQQRQKAAYG